MNKLYRLCFYCLLFSFSLTANAAVNYEIKGSNDEQATANIKAYLSGISEPENIDNVSYLNEVIETAKESVTALGYYHSQFITSINEKTVTLKVNLGERIKIIDVDLRILGEALQDENFQQFVDTFPIKEGEYLNHSDYTAAKSRFNSLAQRYGYFDAEFSKSSVEVTQKNNTATVHLWFDSGIRHQFGELIFDLDTPAEKYIRSLVNFNVNDPFDTNILNSYNQELNQTGYFKSISILPNIEKKQGRNIPLHVITYMKPEDSFTAGLGFSTDEGGRGTFGWNRPWINQYGHSIEASLTASVPKQEASIIYKIPIDDPLYNYYSIQGGYKIVNLNDTDTKQSVVSVNRHWRLDNDWLRTIYLRYDNESGIQGEQDFSTSLLLPGISFSKTRSRGGINVNWGDRKLVYFEFAEDSLLSTDDVIKVYGQTKFIRTYSGHQFIVSAEAGAIFSDSIYNVPSSMRFFTGGDQSIRGYGYEDIAPEDSDGNLVGGSFLAVASVEYRFPITDSWKFAVFSDIGTATDDFSEELSQSVGAGVVWASPVGPIRLYVAAPLTNTDDAYRISFIIGPEL